MEVRERLHLTEGERATNDAFKADISMSFLFFFWLWFPQMQLFPESNKY